MTPGMAVAHSSRVKPGMGWGDEVSELNTTLVDLALRPELQRILCAVRPEVETILNIEVPSDWNFTTQPGAFKRIIMNLYANSLKYTKHGYITVTLKANEDSQPRVQPGEHPQTATVTFVITDTGQGISPAYLRSKLFTAFSQENRKSVGSGLGLSIVKSLVDQLRGNIDIKSVLNIGTTVTITLREFTHCPVSMKLTVALSNETEQPCQTLQQWLSCQRRIPPHQRPQRQRLEEASPEAPSRYLRARFRAR